MESNFYQYVLSALLYDDLFLFHISNFSAFKNLSYFNPWAVIIFCTHIENTHFDIVTYINMSIILMITIISTHLAICIRLVT